MTLSSATTPGQSGPGSNGNEGVFHIHQSSSFTGTLPSDCLVSYPRHSLEGKTYPSAEKQSVYSTTPADWAIIVEGSGNYKHDTLQKIKSHSLCSIISLRYLSITVLVRNIIIIAVIARIVFVILPPRFYIYIYIYIYSFAYHIDSKGHSADRDPFKMFRFLKGGKKKHNFYIIPLHQKALKKRSRSLSLPIQ